MNKQSRKIKKGILLATIAAVIGIGFWVGKTVEPLKAADKEETKQKIRKVEREDESYPLENNDNYTHYPNFTELEMNEGLDYEFPFGWAMGAGNSDAYNFQSYNLPFVNKYQVFSGFINFTGYEHSPTKGWWQLDPDGGAKFAVSPVGYLLNKSNHFDVAQELTINSEGGTKLFYYLNLSDAFIDGISLKGQDLSKDNNVYLNPFGLKSQRAIGSSNPSMRYNLDNDVYLGEENGDFIQLSVPYVIGSSIQADGENHSGSVTFEPEDFVKLAKYADSKMRFRLSFDLGYDTLNAIKINYAQAIQAALFVEKPLEIKVPVGSDVAYLNKEYFKSQIEKKDILVFTDETGKEGMSLPEYGKKYGIEDVDFTVDDVQIDNTYTDTVTKEGGRTSVARISTEINGKKLQGVVPFNLNVVWGNTIALGTETSGADESAVAFSLVKSGEQYEVVQNFGNGWNAKNFPMDKTKVTVDYFKQSGSGTILNIDDQTKPDTSATLSGTDIPTQKANIWGTNGRQKVSIGDVIRVQSNEPAKEWLYKDSQKILTVGDFYQPKVVYYSITADGFQPLYLNQVKGKTNIPAYHKETNVQITADFKTHKDNYIKRMKTGTYTGISWDGEFKTANNPDTSIANRKNVPGTLTLSATMAIGTYTLMVSDFTITPTFDIGAEGVEPPEQEEQWALVLNSNILKEFDVGAAEPSNTTIKDWFSGQVNFRNVNTGELLYSGGGGLPRDNFSVDLVTNWDSKTAGTFPYAVKITVTSEPSSVAGKLVSNTMTTSGNQLQIKFTASTPQVGGDITVEYYVDGSKKSSDTVKGGEVGTVATIPAMDNAANYDFDKAILHDGETVTTWSALTNKVKFTAAAQTVKVYYKTKSGPPASTDVTVKVTMVDPDGNALLFPPGTTNPLELLNSDDTVFTNKSTISSSTVTFDKKIVKGNSYKIKQLKEIPNYNNYAGDLLIGVAEGGGLIIGGMPRPPSDGWSTEQQGISMKFTEGTDTLEVKVKLTKAIKYKLAVDTKTIDLWAGDPKPDLKKTFEGAVKVVEDKTPTPPGMALDANDYDIAITGDWINTVTPVGSPRSFTVKVTPTAAAIAKYPGLATDSGSWLKVNFKEITYDLQATGVEQEYWTNDPQPTPTERLKWVKDVKILPSNTSITTDTTATKVDITGYKEGGITKPTTEVDMSKLGLTTYLVTVTAKNPLKNNAEITLTNVEVPIKIVAPPTYTLKINVVDTDGTPINYEDVSAPFGYTLADQKDWQTESTVADNTITFIKGLDIQSKYQIEQSKVLPPNTSDQIDTEIEHDDPLAGVFPPGNAPAQKDVQELHTKKLTETYPWNQQKPSDSLMISRDEATLSYGSKFFEAKAEPFKITDGVEAQYDKDNRILTLTVTNDQGELSLAVPDLIFEQGTPGILKDQVLGRKAFEVAGKEDPWKVQIKDTLQGTKGWSLEAKLTQPFTLTGENREIKDILIYKDQPTSEQQLMVLNQAMDILDKNTAGAPNAEQFYEKTWDPQAGFLLSVDKQKAMGIKDGVYTAALEFTLKDAD